MLFKCSKSYFCLFLGLSLANGILFGVALSGYVLFQQVLLEIMVIGLDFITLFIVTARRILKPTPDRFWRRFSALILIIFSIYTALTLTIGAPLAAATGFGTIIIPLDTPFTPSEFRILSLYTYGLSSIISALVTLTIAYLLQKYLIHQIFRVYRFLSNYDNFIETNAIKKKSNTGIYILWLALLPLPIQQSLAPNAGVTLVSTVFYLPAVIAALVLWGLSKTYIVGIKNDRIFRIHDVVRSTLFWFVLIQWVTIVVFAFSSTFNVIPDALKLAYGFGKLGILLGTTIFYFAPSAITAAYFYKNALENRAEKNITDYIEQNEKIPRKELKLIAQ